MSEISVKLWHILTLNPAVSVFVIFVIVKAIKDIKNGADHDLKSWLAFGLSGTGVLMGIVLVIAAFDAAILSQIPNFQLYVAIAGVAVLYLAASTAKQLL
jgi:uncharacterized membrane protein